MKKTIFIVLLIVLSFMACNSQKNMNTIPLQTLSFGKGGGFVGNEKKYTLDKKGGIRFEQKEIQTLTEKQTCELFNKANELLSYTYINPSNSYYYIELKSDHGVNRIVWGMGDREVNMQVTQLYEKLNQLLK